MSTLLSEEVINLPNEIVTNSVGLGFDIGGSIAKIVYRSNKEYKNGKPLDPKACVSDKGTLHLAMFARENLDDTIKYIAENSDLTKNADGVASVFATGIGGSQFQDRLRKELGIELTIVNEIEMFAKSFCRLCKILRRDDFVYPQSPAAQEEGARVQKMMTEWLEKAKETGVLKESLFLHEPGSVPLRRSESTDDSSPLPCILLMCGSGTGVLMVKEDGSFKMCDGVIAGGRFFLGMANLLTEEKNFSELMKMAEQSDCRTVDTFMSDLRSGNVGTDIYNMVEDADEMAFPFGKAYTSKREDIKKGDIVRSLYSVQANWHMQIAEMTALVHKIKKVYFCGNFVNSPCARELFETWHVKRRAMFPQAEQMEVAFLRNGGIYGALGAYMHEPAPAAEKQETSHEEAKKD